MAADPAFLLYSKDFLSGVTDLTWEERGQYITMLCVQHQKGVVSTKWLSINLPNASTDVLSKFKRDENGNYYSERLVIEIEKRASFSNYKVASATLGGLISANNVTKEQSKEIRARFNIEDFKDLPQKMVKQKVREWFKRMLDLLVNANVNENTIEDEIVRKGGVGENHLPDLVLHSRSLSTELMTLYQTRMKAAAVEQAVTDAIRRMNTKGMNLDDIQVGLLASLQAYMQFCDQTGTPRKHLNNWLDEEYYLEDWSSKMKEKEGYSVNQDINNGIDLSWMNEDEKPEENDEENENE